MIQQSVKIHYALVDHDLAEMLLAELSAERVAVALAWLSAADRKTLRVSVPLNDFATRFGFSRSLVTRTISDLKKNGKIQYEGGSTFLVEKLVRDWTNRLPYFDYSLVDTLVEGGLVGFKLILFMMWLTSKGTKPGANQLDIINTAPCEIVASRIGAKRKTLERAIGLACDILGKKGIEQTRRPMQGKAPEYKILWKPAGEPRKWSERPPPNPRTEAILRHEASIRKTHVLTKELRAKLRAAVMAEKHEEGYTDYFKISRAIGLWSNPRKPKELTDVASLEVPEQHETVSLSSAVLDDLVFGSSPPGPSGGLSVYSGGKKEEKR